MRLLSLLFDPRGAIDRRAFWSGLAQLTVVSAVVFAGLERLDLVAAMGAVPIVGEAFTLSPLAGWITGGQTLDVSLAAALLIIAARLYATACLMLKRARDAGKGAGAPAAFGVAVLLIHAAMCAWTVDLFGEGMAVIIPLIGDLALTTVLSSVFTIWLGSRGSVPTDLGRLNPRHDLQFT